MLRESVLQNLTEILREVFNDESLVARADLTVDDVKGWDSFGHLRLTFAVEKRFGIDFSMSQVTSVRSIGELLDLIESNSAAAIRQAE